MAGTETEYRLSVLSWTETGTVPTYRQMDCNALVAAVVKVAAVVVAVVVVAIRALQSISL